MKGLRSIPRVLKITGIEGYNLSLLFNNGESRIVNIEKLFTGEEKKGHVDLEQTILNKPGVFASVQVIGNTIGWPGVGIYSEDFEGKSVFYPFDLDPIVLFQAGTPDPKDRIAVGDQIKRLRLEQGLTQEQLAKRSGTSKHYISRLENNKSDIEVMTLRKIVEAGLDRKLSLQIQ